MQVMNHKVAVLSMLASLEGAVEREINRDILVDVAPDREEFLRGTATIEEIRQSLKLRTNLASSHWLRQTEKKRDFLAKDASKRFSDAGIPSPVKKNKGKGKAKENPPVEPKTIRRVRRQPLTISISAANNYMANTSTHSRFPSDLASTLDIHPPLSTEDKLISPRPLGPTHMLIVYATHASKNTLSPYQKRDPSNTFRQTRRRTMIAPTYSQVVEIPINDLLFLLNVPNLMPPASNDVAILPRRLYEEMPLVMMYVPHLETFPELVIYLHTKNLAGLFRSMIPEWIRDAIHPLPSASSPSTVPVPSTTPAPASNHMDAEAPSKLKVDGTKIKKLLGRLVPEGLPFSTGTRAVPARSLASVATELAQMSAQIEGGGDDLLFAAAQLTALRNNLGYIGYYDKSLWSELTAYRSIMIQAISHCANIDTIAAS